MTTENAGRLKALLDETLTGEPPLLDLVPGAAAGADRGRRRTRVMAGGAAVAVLAVTAGAYGLVGTGHGGSPASSAPPAGVGGNSPSGRLPTPKPPSTLPTLPEFTLGPTHKSTFGLTGLFDHPGTPQEQCAKLKAPAGSSAALVASARDFCARALTQIRALLPEDVVVLEPMINFNQPAWSEPLAKTPDGGTLAGFAQAYQKAFENPATVAFDENAFAFRGPNGDGTVTYETLKPGVTSKPQPGGDLPLGDGTFGHLSPSDNGDVKVNGVTADGHWYNLWISGVYTVYGESGGWLSPTFKGDGRDRELFPDGYVMALPPGGGRYRIPNPYTAAQVRDLVTARGLGAMVTAIGSDPLSFIPPQGAPGN